jgi:hypothetical protein
MMCGRKQATVAAFSRTDWERQKHSQSESEQPVSGDEVRIRSRTTDARRSVNNLRTSDSSELHLTQRPVPARTFQSSETNATIEGRKVRSCSPVVFVETPETQHLALMWRQVSLNFILSLRKLVQLRSEADWNIRRFVLSKCFRRACSELSCTQFLPVLL